MEGGIIMARAKGLPVINRKLTADQKRRGVIFSSALVADRNQKDTAPGVQRSEVLSSDRQAQHKIERLKDTRFFSNAPDSPYKYNIIRS